MFVEVYINSCFWNGKLAEMQKANIQEKKKVYETFTGQP